MSHPYAPHGYRIVTPYFIVQDANKMLEFAKAVFDAEEISRSVEGDGRVTHAEARIGDMIVELSDAGDRFPPRANTLHIFVADTDNSYRRALEAGAVSLYEPADKTYGERSAGVEDPFGNHWYIATFLGGEGHGYK